MKMLRHRCRRCRTNLASPVEIPRLAFCCAGCHRRHFRHRCIVCEEPAKNMLCHRADCRSRYRKSREAYAYTRSVKAPSESAHFTGVKTRLKVWGPPISDVAMRSAMEEIGRKPTPKPSAGHRWSIRDTIGIVGPKHVVEIESEDTE